jgi:hypothetical protein
MKTELKSFVETLITNSMKNYTSTEAYKDMNYFFRQISLIKEAILLVNKDSQNRNLKEWIDLFLLQMILLWILQEYSDFFGNQKYFLKIFKKADEENTTYLEKIYELLHDIKVGKLFGIGRNTNFSSKTSITEDLILFPLDDIELSFEIPNRLLFAKNLDITSEKMTKKQLIPLLNLLMEISWQDNYYADYFFGSLFEKFMKFSTRKKTGSYYTPIDVTQYICSRIMIDYLNDKFFSNSTLSHNIRSFSDFIVTILDDVKILDPAMGSGHFLITIYNLLIDVHAALRNKYNINQKRRIEEIAVDIIQNNLYGVELNLTAIKVAKARSILFLFTKFPEANILLSKEKLSFNFVNKNFLFFDDPLSYSLVVGNPPYGNILSKKEKMKLGQSSYLIKNTNEVAAIFLEKIMQVLEQDGWIGLLLANSIAINKSTSDIREIIRKNMKESKMAIFGTRPGKIFFDTEIRVMMFFGKKTSVHNEKGIIYTSEAIKFSTKDRNTLFSNITYENTDGLCLGKEKIGDGYDTSLPKVGNRYIKTILEKLRESSTITVQNVLMKNKTPFQLQYRATGGYWLNALEKMPYNSSKIKSLFFKSELERDFCLILINSSLFYLYWSTYSNLRDLPVSLIVKFPYPLKETLEKEKERINELKNNFSVCLLKSFKPSMGRVGEFRTGFCKNIIDKIDRLITVFYSITEDELCFIQNYDNFIRINQNEKILKE